MRRTVAVGLIVVTAVIVGILGHQPASSAARSMAPGVLPPLASTPASTPGEVPRDDDGPLTADDGVLPAGATVFDSDYPGIGNLNADLLGALRQAANRAAKERIEFDVTSGWRSAAYQDRLLREAVSKYGSVNEAARWVATAETSPHVSGDAV